jgi:hypothetical protein
MMKDKVPNEKPKKIKTPRKPKKKAVACGVLMWALLLMVSSVYAKDWKFTVKACNGVHVKEIMICESPTFGEHAKPAYVPWKDPFEYSIEDDYYPNVGIVVNSTTERQCAKTGIADQEFGVDVEFLLYFKGQLLQSRKLHIGRPDDMGFNLNPAEDHD